MIIKSISVKNKFICYENLSLDLSNLGLYKISGANGSGKTTLLREILFGNYDVSFENEDLYKVWKNNRGTIFSYVSQNISYCNCYVYEYLSMGNINIKKDTVFNLLDDFELNNEILKKNFKDLSGGEKKKLQIISALLKNTPYLFLDEPSNNLDDNSTNVLKEKILLYSKEHTVILISHDERLNIPGVEYLLNGNEVNKVSFDSHLNRNLLKPVNINRKFVFVKTINLLKSLSNLITILIVLSVLISLVAYSNHEINSNFNFETHPKENRILVQGTLNYDDNLLGNYIKGENLYISESAKGNYPDLNDVLDIVSLEGVSKIYMTDFKYKAEIEKKIYNNELSENLNFISCPSDYYDIFWDNCILDYGLNLNEGNYPCDYGYEVSISKNLLIQQFGYLETNVSDAIGKSITLTVNGIEHQYEIVGFSYFDLVHISFKDENNFGVYTFNENTYEEYGNTQIEFDTERDACIGLIREMIILTLDNYEGNVLDHLITHYASANYYSYQFSSVWSKTYNQDRIIQILIPNIIISCILSIGLVFINNKSVALNYSQLTVYGNYYINRKKLKIRYIVFSTIEYLLLFVISILLNSLVSPYFYITNWIMAIDYFVLILPLTITHIKNLLKVDK